MPIHRSRKMRETKNHKLKSYKPHKPDSVSKLSFIWPQHYCYDLAAYPGSLPLKAGSDEPPSKNPIRGITAPKVYPYRMLPNGTVSFYLTFSPFLRTCILSSYFLWHFLSPAMSGRPAINRWVALRCPDFPWRQRRHDSSGL